MQQLSNLLNAYTKAYNKVYGRRGALWIDCTKRFKVDSADYLTQVIKYIHQNPVKHGFVDDIGDWNHSSYASHISTKATELSRVEVLELFEGDENYLNTHKADVIGQTEDWE